MNVLDDMMLVYRVAKSYYVDGVGQSEIAKITGISRPQISRLIKRGLELGIVKIDVSMPESVSIRDMERELTSCLGIQSVRIIAVQKTDENDKDNFFAPAAKYVAENLEACVNIGIGWGRSLYQVSRQLSYQLNREQVMFYPLVGCSGDDNPYLQVGSIMDRFAEHYYAKARYLNLPVYRKNASLTEDEERRLNLFQNKWRHLDGAVVGIGEFNTDNQIYIDEVSLDPYLQERKNEVVGDVLAHLLLKKGGELVLPGYSHVACSLEDLKRIPEVVGVARGIAKAEAIYCVVQRGYIKTLITDDVTAREILKNYEFKKQR